MAHARRVRKAAASRFDIVVKVKWTTSDCPVYQNCSLTAMKRPQRPLLHADNSTLSRSGVGQTWSTHTPCSSVSLRPPTSQTAAFQALFGLHLNNVWPMHRSCCGLRSSRLLDKYLSLCWGQTL